MKGLPFLVVLEMGGLFLYSTSLCCHVSSCSINEICQRLQAVKRYTQVSVFRHRVINGCAPLWRSLLSLTPPRNPARRTQQLILPLAPLAQLSGIDGVAA